LTQLENSHAIVAFTDACNTLGMGGKVIRLTKFIVGRVTESAWSMHLNDAAHYTVSRCAAGNIVVQLRLTSFSEAGNTPTVQEAPTSPQHVVEGGKAYLTVRAITHASHAQRAHFKLHNAWE
jgi:hypothetical protein